MLPLLAILLAATTAITVSALFALQDFDEACTQIETGVAAAPLRARLTGARRRVNVDVERRGVLVRDPKTQGEVREMVAFCDTAAQGDVEALREVALHGENVLAAANAIRALGRLRAVARDPELRALLADPRERIRDETILALGESRDRDAVALLEPLVSGDDAKARVLAIHALGRLGGERAEAVLRQVLESASASREDLAFVRAAMAAAKR